MSCERYQSLPLDELELAEVPFIPVLLRNEAESRNSSPNNGADAPGATRSSSEPRGMTI